MLGLLFAISSPGPGTAATHGLGPVGRFVGCSSNVRGLDPPSAACFILAPRSVGCSRPSGWICQAPRCPATPSARSPTSKLPRDDAPGTSATWSLSVAGAAVLSPAACASRSARGPPRVSRAVRPRPPSGWLRFPGVFAAPTCASAKTRAACAVGVSRALRPPSRSPVSPCARTPLTRLDAAARAPSGRSPRAPEDGGVFSAPPRRAPDAGRSTRGGRRRRPPRAACRTAFPIEPLTLMATPNTSGEPRCLAARV